jgi:hypothetical protein
MLTTADAAALAEHFDVGTDPPQRPVAAASRARSGASRPVGRVGGEGAVRGAAAGRGRRGRGVPGGGGGGRRACADGRSHDDGAVFAEVGSAAVRLFGWVDLRERSAMVDPGAVAAPSPPSTRCPAGRLPVDEWYTDPIGADRWDELVTLLSEAGAPFAADLAGYRDDLVHLETLMEAPAELRTCHRDLFADNVLGTKAGGLCVIDWENCGLADPSQELGLVAFDFGAGDPDRITALLIAYTAAGGPGRLDRPSRCSMVMRRWGTSGSGAAVSGWRRRRRRRGAPRPAWRSSSGLPPHAGRGRADRRGGRRRGASRGWVVADP